MIKSRIYLSDVVENKNPKPNANSRYFAAKMVDGLGRHYNLLFTEDDILDAKARGEKNSEDFPVAEIFRQETFWEKLKLW